MALGDPRERPRIKSPESTKGRKSRKRTTHGFELEIILFPSHSHLEPLCLCTLSKPNTHYIFLSFPLFLPLPSLPTIP